MRPEGKGRGKNSRTIRDAKTVNVRGPPKVGNITQAYQSRVARVFEEKRPGQNYQPPASYKEKFIQKINE